MSVDTDNRVEFARVGSVTLLRRPDGDRPPAAAARLVESQLVYNHVSFTHGARSYDEETGRYSGFNSERRKLYSYHDGFPVFQRGFERRIWDGCIQIGLQPSFVDTTPPHPRPDRFDFRPERVFERMQLRARQDECLAAIAGHEYGQIHAPTGMGKGYIIASVALAFPRARIAVVTYRKDVVGTLVRRLTEFLPAVGQVGAGKERVERVTVYTADSMHKIPHDAADEPDILLYDEGHEAPTPKRLTQLARFTHARCYMLTGSPDCRSDNADFRLEGYFGRPVFVMTYPEAVELKLVLPIKVFMVPVDCFNPAADIRREDIIGRERAGVWRNDARNRLIAGLVRSVPADVQTLVLVKSAEHALWLKAHLPEFTLCYDTVKPATYRAAVSAGFVDPVTDPPMTAQARRRLTTAFERGEVRKVICTDVWSTGVSFDELGVILRADARASKGISIQAPGRTCRRFDADAKEYGLAIDLVDKFDSAFHRRSQERERVYRSMGWEITRMTPEQVADFWTAQTSAARPT